MGGGGRKGAKQYLTTDDNLWNGWFCAVFFFIDATVSDLFSLSGCAKCGSRILATKLMVLMAQTAHLLCTSVR